VLQSRAVTPLEHSKMRVHKLSLMHSLAEVTTINHDKQSFPTIHVTSSVKISGRQQVDEMPEINNRQSINSSMISDYKYDSE